MLDETYIWIEAEEWAPGEWDPNDCNSDVKVSFRHGAEWVATFFTYKNIATLVGNYRRTGELLSGKYFWATDMVLVDELTRQRVEEVVAHLIETGDFENYSRTRTVCRRLSLILRVHLANSSVSKLIG